MTSSFTRICIITPNTELNVMKDILTRFNISIAFETTFVHINVIPWKTPHGFTTGFLLVSSPTSRPSFSKYTHSLCLNIHTHLA